MNMRYKMRSPDTSANNTIIQGSKVRWQRGNFCGEREPGSSPRTRTQDSAKRPRLPTATARGDGRVAPRAALLVPPPCHGHVGACICTHRVEKVGTRARTGVKPRLWDPPMHIAVSIAVYVSMAGRRPGRRDGRKRGRWRRGKG